MPLAIFHHDIYNVSPFNSFTSTATDCTLNAFLRGEITRLAVVEHLDSAPTRMAAGQLPESVKDLLRRTDRRTQYAAAGDQPRSAPVASAETTNAAFTPNPAFEAKY